MSKTKNKVGRPPKLNENTVKKLEEIFRWWWSVTQACLYAGISRDVFYEWINKKDEFSDKKCKDFINRIELAREYPNMACKRIILKEWTKWNWKAAAWWLERKDPEFKKETKNNDKKDNKNTFSGFTPFSSIQIREVETWELIDEIEIKPPTNNMW
jgi:hypothetical protein